MSQKEQQMLLVLLSVLVSFALGYFVLRPQLTNLHGSQLGVAARLQEINELESRKSQLAALKETLAKHAPSLIQLDQAVPATPAYPELLVELATISEQTGMRLATIQPAQASQSSLEQLATVTLKGNFTQLVDFSRSAALNLRPLALKTINIAKTGSTDGDGLAVTIQISLARADLGSGGGSQ